MLFSHKNKHRGIENIHSAPYALLEDILHDVIFTWKVIAWRAQCRLARVDIVVTLWHFFFVHHVWSHETANGCWRDGKLALHHTHLKEGSEVNGSSIF